MSATATLLPGQRVLLDTDDSPHGTWRRGEPGEVVQAEGRYWQVRLERSGVVLVFARAELIPAPADRGSTSVAVVLAACITGALLALAVIAGGQRALCHLHDDALAYCPSPTHDRSQ